MPFVFALRPAHLTFLKARPCWAVSLSSAAGLTVLASIRDEGNLPAPCFHPLKQQIPEAPCGVQLVWEDQAGDVLCGMQSAMGGAAAAAVKAVWAQDGPEAARHLYQRILALPPPGLAVFNAILDLELAFEAAGPCRQGPARIKQVFEVCYRWLLLNYLCCLVLIISRKALLADPLLQQHSCLSSGWEW